MHNVFLRSIVGYLGGNWSWDVVAMRKIKNQLIELEDGEIMLRPGDELIEVLGVDEQVRGSVPIMGVVVNKKYLEKLFSF